MVLDDADALAELGAIAWLVLGLVLVGLEIVAPGAYLLWFGLAALATGALVFAADMAGADLPLAGQVVAFAVLAAVAVYEGRRRLARDDDTDAPHLNTGATRLVGTRHTLEKPIVGGRGRLKVGDGWWSVDGPDLPAGAKVEVIGVEGTRLRVAPSG